MKESASYTQKRRWQVLNHYFQWQALRKRSPWYRSHPRELTGDQTQKTGGIYFSFMWGCIRLRKHLGMDLESESERKALDNDVCVNQLIIWILTKKERKKERKKGKMHTLEILTPFINFSAKVIKANHN